MRKTDTICYKSSYKNPFVPGHETVGSGRVIMRRVADPDPHGSALFLEAVPRSGSALERLKLDPALDSH
jgi:hypothetical protein